MTPHGTEAAVNTRTAIITGAGTGVGRAAAVALGGDGWHLRAIGRRSELLEETASLVRDAGGTCETTACDVTDADAVADLFDDVGAKGRLDLLFNNAGTGAPSVPMEELSLEQWTTVVNVNLTASFVCAQHAIRLMKAQDPSGGRIINNGSVSAHTPRPNSAPYTATKHAITGLTKSISLDGREFAITCGQIDIGNASSPMTARMSQGVPQADGSIRAEPTIDPSTVGRAVAYMASLPLDTNVLTMTVMANGMPFVGRG
ncbi:MAG: SDR family NAD(P)-dependent oxidoreductase [Actinomycetota bacterium]|jgi:NAD(P)-dependent dehydrogenase (short-subunit alcohol dehydrogenase family)|nr:SDR family NAD(P)-dependent oxidoreductase [Actinomycetota bacterium]